MKKLSQPPQLFDRLHEAPIESPDEILPNQGQQQSQSEPLPVGGVFGSSLQPVSNRLCRYIGRSRTIDQPSTKSWRKRMRALQFQIFRVEPWVYEKLNLSPPEPNGYVNVLGSDGNYYHLAERDLHLEGAETQHSSIQPDDDLWDGEEE